MKTSTNAGRAAETTAAAGGAVLVGAVAALLVSSRSPVAAVVLAAAVVPAIFCTVDVRRVLLAAALIDIPLQLGKFFFYRQHAAALGAIGGLEVSITTIAVVVLYGWWILDALLRKDVPRPRLAAAVPLLLYLAVTALSAVVASDRPLVGYEVVLLVQSLLLFVYVASHIQRRSDVLFVASVIVGSLLFEALVVIAAWRGLIFPLQPRQPTVATIGSVVRLGGTVGSPNTAGSFFAATLPIAAALALAPVPRRIRLLGMAAFPPGCVALVLTFSRGAWISAAIGIGLVTVAAFRRGWMPSWSPLVLLVAPLALAGPLLREAASRITGNDMGSAAGRGPLMDLARDLIVHHPYLGVGANNVGPAMAASAGPEFSRSWIYTVHDKYLLVWAGSGIGALLAFVWFLVATVRRGLLASRSADPVLAAIAIALTGAVIGQMVHMTVELFQSRPQVQLLWVIAGLLVAMTHLDPEARHA
jgi:hypothetical protein